MILTAPSEIEVIHQLPEIKGIHYALFDFDGTLSLIREGWQAIMIPMMIEIMLQTPEHENEAEISRIVRDFVTQLTGKQTIFQMIRLAEEVEKRGGKAEDPLEYKNEYHRRLLARIQYRLDGLRSGSIEPEAYLVPGALSILTGLKTHGVKCYLASGTDEAYVLDEVNLLGLTPYFDGIYGAQDDYKNFSKRIVIQRIIKENKLSGPEFVGFGDGFVEIEDTKSVNGIAVGVATNEETREGIDEWKRSRLIEAGADLIIPDFRVTDKLLPFLLPLE
ncbi:MAG: HAD family hydrolase [Flexilinea sp.]